MSPRPYTPRRTVPRLPVAPLLPHLEREAWWNDQTRRYGGRTDAYVTRTTSGPPVALQRLLGCERRKAQRIVSEGLIREDDADLVAAKLGLHPADIWGGAWWAHARH